MNKIYETEEFSKLYFKLEKDEVRWIEKIKNRLKEILEIGKPLKYYWFRQKKYRNKRLFFVINSKTKKVLLVTFKDKRFQNDIIDRVIKDKEIYLREIK